MIETAALYNYEVWVLQHLTTQAFTIRRGLELLL
jgi:hypothetical protein